MHIILCAKTQNYKEVKKCLEEEVIDGYTMQQECQDG
jgi:hypothetical protein